MAEKSRTVYQSSHTSTTTPGTKEEHYSKSSPGDYTSDGVKDNDIFSLPSVDWQWLGALTVLGAAVRLFKIYQPASVVFDEVQ